MWSHRISGPLWIMPFCALLGCGGSYQPDLLAEVPTCGNGRVDQGELCDKAILAGLPGACPVECADGEACAPNKLVGPACERQCVAVPIEQARSGDSCCPPGINALQDSDCGFCGDAIVGPNETCDPVETCPTRATCETENACLSGVFSGDPKSCDARCELKTIKTCRSEDGCCPAGCGQDTDGDCSSACGDGTVDRGYGETCETNVAAPCPTACDDGDPCTGDLMIGSSENCNSECTYPSITQPTNEDGCCPTGASSLNDSDCEPMCGNGIAEPGEECDGGDLCTPACVALTPEEHECLALPTTATDACRDCGCKRCAEEVLGCYASDDPARDMRCSTVVECANQAGCVETTCYCGTSGPDCAAPDGPCRTQIEQAAGSAYRATVLACSNNQNCALYRSNAIGECRKANCASECGLMPAATPL